MGVAIVSWSGDSSVALFDLSKPSFSIPSSVLSCSASVVMWPFRLASYDPALDAPVSKVSTLPSWSNVSRTNDRLERTDVANGRSVVSVTTIITIDEILAGQCQRSGFSDHCTAHEPRRRPRLTGPRPQCPAAPTRRCLECPPPGLLPSEPPPTLSTPRRPPTPRPRNA